MREYDYEYVGGTPFEYKPPMPVAEIEEEVLTRFQNADDKRKVRIALAEFRSLLSREGYVFYTP